MRCCHIEAVVDPNLRIYHKRHTRIVHSTKSPPARPTDGIITPPALFSGSGWRAGAPAAAPARAPASPRAPARRRDLGRASSWPTPARQRGAARGGGVRGGGGARRRAGRRGARARRALGRRLLRAHRGGARPRARDAGRGAPHRHTPPWYTSAGSIFYKSGSAQASWTHATLCGATEAHAGARPMPHSTQGHGTIVYDRWPRGAVLRGILLLLLRQWTKAAASRWPHSSRSPSARRRRPRCSPCRPTRPATSPRPPSSRPSIRTTAASAPARSTPPSSGCGGARCSTTTARTSAWWAT